MVSFEQENTKNLSIWKTFSGYLPYKGSFLDVRTFMLA